MNADDGTYLAIGISGNFKLTHDITGYAKDGRWTYVPGYVGVVSIPFPSSAEQTFISAVCPDDHLRFDPGYTKYETR